MTAPAHQDPNGGLFRNEPVMVLHLVMYLLGNLGLWVVGRTHLVSSAEWSAGASAAAPVITGAVLFLQAWVIRRYVAPAWKSLQREAAKDGLVLPDLPAGGLSDLTGAIVAARQASTGSDELSASAGLVEPDGQLHPSPGPG